MKILLLSWQMIKEIAISPIWKVRFVEYLKTVKICDTKAEANRQKQIQMSSSLNPSLLFPPRLKSIDYKFESALDGVFYCYSPCFSFMLSACVVISKTSHKDCIPSRSMSLDGSVHFLPKCRLPQWIFPALCVLMNLIFNINIFSFEPGLKNIYFEGKRVNLWVNNLISEIEIEKWFYGWEESSTLMWTPPKTGKWDMDLQTAKMLC